MVANEHLADRLRDAGLRVTGHRISVLRTLADAVDHPSVDQVVSRVRGSGVSMSVQAGYDVCEALHAAGLARRLEPAGGPVRYEARVGDNHHHLICRSCGVAADVDCAIGTAPCLEPAQRHGFRLEEAEVTYWGLCPTCQAEPIEGSSA